MDQVMTLGISVRNVSVSYAQTPVLQSIDLEIGAGQTLALTGPSGSGKSTLLGCITGLVVPTSGVVQVGDVCVTDLNETRRTAFRRARVARLVQAPGLLPELAVIENVALIALFDGVARATARSLAAESLEAVGLAGFEKRRVDELSGGEAQRVAIARALSREGVGLLVADEPTAALDAHNVGHVTDVLLEFARRRGVTVLVATHDSAVAQRMDSIVNLSELVQASAA